jgi:hypothetical protein
MIDTTTRDIGDPITVSLVDGPWLVALAADAKMLPIVDADRIEFGRALILQGYDASRALRMIRDEIEDNDGALQMLARHRVAIGELAAHYRAALEAIDKAVMDGHVCDDVAWFDKFTTLHDFIDGTLRPCQPAAIGDLFPAPSTTRVAPPADVCRLVVAAREVLDDYGRESVDEQRAGHDTLRQLDKAAEAFASRVCWDDDDGSLPEAHAALCTCDASDVELEAGR